MMETYILNILSEKDVFDYRSSALSNAFLPTCKARRASSVKATRVAKRKAKDGKRWKIQIAAQSSRAIRFPVILAPPSTSARSRKPIMWLT